MRLEKVKKCTWGLGMPKLKLECPLHYLSYSYWNQHSCIGLPEFRIGLPEFLGFGIREPLESLQKFGLGLHCR